LLIGDMPFMTYQIGPDQALRNAGRYLQEAGMDAVKIEGGRDMAATARTIVRAGIPVQGHIGLTPQSVNVLGGWKVQGRTAEAAKALVDDALALQDAGCFSIVLESVPDRLASHITQRLQVPTIGIGAGAGTSGQVLVIHDLVGLFEGFKPKFVKRYAQLAEPMRAAVRDFIGEVESGAFPDADYSYHMPDEAWEAFLGLIEAELVPRRRQIPRDGKLLAQA
jgi:3-methyl-2-oxobutanoate hydroxymethyltransferase